MSSMKDELDDISRQGPTVTAFTVRKPPFNKIECFALMDLVDQHKAIILDKCTNAAACSAKDSAWNNIAKLFNNMGFATERDLDCIKLKWDNMKKSARKRTKNLSEIRYHEYDDVTGKMVTLLCEAESMNASKSSDDSNEQTPADESNWEAEGLEDETENSEEDVETNQEKKSIRDLNRSLNFTPQDCNKLLQCVKVEKKYIFCKGISPKAAQMKANAWNRVSIAFNKGSIKKRSTKVLKNKFDNMKKLARGTTANPGRQASKTQGSMVYKKEKMEHDDIEQYGMQNGVFSNKEGTEPHEGLTMHGLCQGEAAAGQGDPLRHRTHHRFVQPGSEKRYADHYESLEVIKLKTELLTYQLETAKMKRERELKEQASSESWRQIRAQVVSYELRRARLEAALAERHALDAGLHHALPYTAHERHIDPQLTHILSDTTDTYATCTYNNVCNQNDKV